MRDYFTMILAMLLLFGVVLGLRRWPPAVRGLTQKDISEGRRWDPQR